jgi:hypothetical protein
MSQKHIILGRDRDDAEAKRDRWLSDKPKTLLTRIGGWNVPRVSIEVDYE